MIQIKRSMKGGILSAPAGGSKNARVVRDNQLVRSSYRLLPIEKRLVYWLFWKYQETGQREQTIYINELAKFCGMKGGDTYRRMYDMTHQLQGRVLVIWDEAEGCPSFINFTEKISPNLGEGTITLVLHGELAPLIEKTVDGNQTITKLEIACRLKSFYAMRLYDIAMCHGFRKSGYIYHVQELKAEMGVLELRKKNKMEVSIKTDRYPDWRRFKEKVLDRAMKEVNEMTDIEVELRPIKAGRSVQTVHITSRKKGSDDMYAGLNTVHVGLVKVLCDTKMPVKEAKKWVQRYGDDDPSMITYHARECKKKKTPLAWLRAGLKNDYRKTYSSAGFDRAEQLSDLRKRNSRQGSRKHEGPKSLGELLK